MEFSFGKWVKQRRRAIDLTQAELAWQVGCSPSLIFKIEADARRPSRQIAELLSVHLEIPSDQHEKFMKEARQKADLNPLEAGPVLALWRLQPARQYATPHLPTPHTPLVGRVFELQTILQKIQDPTCRLLTLTGPGGVGKTRLALEVAHLLQKADPETKIFYVPLSGTSESKFIIPALADALGFVFSRTQDLESQLFYFLKGKRFLVILDNLEHLLDGIELLTQLLENAPPIKLLATSYEPLNLHSEWVFEVKGLPVPTSLICEHLEANDAAALFIQRANQVKVHFSPDPVDLPAIIRICQLVDGLPLGLELAATWVRFMSLKEIANEIEVSLDFLTTTARDIPERHRSLHIVFDHSWKLLSEMERQVLPRLSVFRGGFSRAAADSVAGANLPLLMRLMDKSLVHRNPDGRFDLHELICRYTSAILSSDANEAAAVYTRHANYYLKLLEKNESPLGDERQKETLEDIKPEIDNIRLAWNFAVDNGMLDQLHGAAGSLHYFYEFQQFFIEGKDLFQRAAERIQMSLDAYKGKFQSKEQKRLQEALADMQKRQSFFRQRLGQF